MNRRLFFNSLLIGVGGASILKERAYANKKKNNSVVKTPVSICTWDFKEANFQAGMALESGKDALSSAIIGANVEEYNPKNSTVGYGGAPDREGTVTLDAAVMDYKGDCGSVLGVEKVVNVSSLARDVMEKTPHVILSGKGAQNFAIAHGFKIENLLTEKARKIWLRWKENISDKDDWFPPKDNSYNNERSTGTINVLAVDSNSDVAGITTTSGLAYKIPGRIGDSPIIGAGLYVDNEVGAAGATGRGEEILRTCGSFFVVEQMRNGKTPQEACEALCKKIVDINGGTKNIDFNDKIVALGKDGSVGCASIKEKKGNEPKLSYWSKNGFKVYRGTYLIEE